MTNEKDHTGDPQPDSQVKKGQAKRAGGHGQTKGVAEPLNPPGSEKSSTTSDNPERAGGSAQNKGIK